MDVVRQIKHNGESLTIIEDEQGYFIVPVYYMLDIAEKLLYTCNQLTDEDIILKNKKEVLDRSPSMFHQIYGENDPMWAEFQKNYVREPIKKPSRKKLKGHVYFLKCTQTFLYKIGYSTNVKTRIRDIQRASPTVIELAWVLPSDDCIADERCCHKLFGSNRVKGEWFDLKEDDIQSLEGLVDGNEI